MQCLACKQILKIYDKTLILDINLTIVETIFYRKKTRLNYGIVWKVVQHCKFFVLQLFFKFEKKIYFDNNESIRAENIDLVLIKSSSALNKLRSKGKKTIIYILHCKYKLQSIYMSVRIRPHKFWSWINKRIHGN